MASRTAPGRSPGAFLIPKSPNPQIPKSQSLNPFSGASLQVLKLQLVQPAVESAAGEHLLVRADVDDFTRLHGHDPVGQRQRGQPMRPR